MSLTLFNLAAQPENTYTLKGFTVGSKCVVWSRHTWSKCEILEIAEEGTKVSKMYLNVLYRKMYLKTVKEILQAEKMHPPSYFDMSAKYRLKSS